MKQNVNVSRDSSFKRSVVFLDDELMNHFIKLHYENLTIFERELSGSIPKVTHGSYWLYMCISLKRLSSQWAQGKFTDEVEIVYGINDGFL